MICQSSITYFTPLIILKVPETTCEANNREKSSAEIKNKSSGIDSSQLAQETPSKFPLRYNNFRVLEVYQLLE